MTWLMLLTLLGISLVCAFYGTSLLLWTAAMAAGIFVFAVAGSVPVLSIVLVGSFRCHRPAAEFSALAPAIDQRAIPQTIPPHVAQHV